MIHRCQYEDKFGNIVRQCGMVPAPYFGEPLGGGKPVYVCDSHAHFITILEPDREMAHGLA